MRQAFLLTAFLGLGLGLGPSAVPSFGEEACQAPIETCVKSTFEWFQSKGWVGVELEINESGRYRITRVVEDSPAAEAGLQVDDELVALDGISYADESAAERLKAHYQERIKPGNTVTYTVAHGERTREVKIVLGSVPQEVVECWLGRHLLQQHLAEIMKTSAAEP